MTSEEKGNLYKDIAGNVVANPAAAMEYTYQHTDLRGRRLEGLTIMQIVHGGFLSGIIYAIEKMDEPIEVRTAAAELDSGELNEAIGGLTLKAGVSAGLSRDQIGALMDGIREALETTTKSEAEEILHRYMSTGNLPG